MLQRSQTAWAIRLAMVALGLLLAATWVGAESVNLVNNGSFENVDANGKIPGFEFWQAEGDVKISSITGIARTGEKSVMIAGTKAPRGAVNFKETIEGGATYRFSVWYRHTIKGPWAAPSANGLFMGHHVLIRLMAYGADGKKIPWKQEWLADPNEGWFDVRENMHVLPAPWENPGPEEWSELKVTVNFPKEAVRIEVNMFNWFGEGELYYDDFAVIKL